jgi:hypothetical protein
MQEKENTIKIILRRFVIFANFLTSGMKLIISGPYWHNKVISKVLLLDIILNISNWLYLFSKRTEGGFPIILHYNLFFGVDLVGDYNRLFLIPLIGLVIFILNSLFGNFFYKIERLASYLLTLNVLIIQIFLLLSSFLIIKVNS